MANKLKSAIAKVKEVLTPQGSPVIRRSGRETRSLNYEALHRGEPQPHHSASGKADVETAQATLSVEEMSDREVLNELNGHCGEPDSQNPVEPVAEQLSESEALRRELEAEEERQAELKRRKEKVQADQLRLKLSLLKRQNDEEELYITESEREMQSFNQKTPPAPPAKVSTGVTKPKQKKKKQKKKAKAAATTVSGGAAAEPKVAPSKVSRVNIASVKNQSGAHDVLKRLGLGTASSGSSGEELLQGSSQAAERQIAADNAQQKWRLQAENRIRQTGEFSQGRGSNVCSTTDANYGKNKSDLAGKDVLGGMGEKHTKSVVLSEEVPLTVNSLLEMMPAIVSASISASFSGLGLVNPQVTQALPKVEEPEEKSKFKWPHKHLGWRFGAKEGKAIRYHDLDLKAFVAGELNIIAQANEEERQHRMELLCDMLSYSSMYKWEACLRFHFAVLSRIDNGESQWGESYSRQEQILLNPYPIWASSKPQVQAEEGKKKTKASKKKGEPVYCAEYQKGTCTHKDTHEGEFFGSETTLHHLCSKCLSLGARANHPANADSCPNKQ